MPALCTTRRKIPFRMSWRNVHLPIPRGMGSDGRAPHSAVSLGGAKGGAEVALHGGVVGGQLADAEAVVEADRGADSPDLEFKRRSAGESVEPGRRGAAGAAKQARVHAPPLHAVGNVGLVERVEIGLGLLPCKDAFGPGDVAQALGEDLLRVQLGLPEVSASLCRSSHPGGPGPEHLAAEPVEGPERLRPAALPSAGLVRERPRPPWRRGRVMSTWSVRGRSSVV
jgi:hypothetical protein